VKLLFIIDVSLRNVYCEWTVLHSMVSVWLHINQ